VVTNISAEPAASFFRVERIEVGASSETLVNHL
jgi:hypothetical protein